MWSIFEYKETGTWIGFSWVKIAELSEDEKQARKEFELFLKTKEATGKRRTDFKLDFYVQKEYKSIVNVNEIPPMKKFDINSTKARERWNRGEFDTGV